MLTARSIVSFTRAAGRSASSGANGATAEAGLLLLHINAVKYVDMKPVIADLRSHLLSCEKAEVLKTAIKNNAMLPCRERGHMRYIMCVQVIEASGQVV